MAPARRQARYVSARMAAHSGRPYRPHVAHRPRRCAAGTVSALTECHTGRVLSCRPVPSLSPWPLSRSQPVTRPPHLSDATTTRGARVRSAVGSAGQPRTPVRSIAEHIDRTRPTHRRSKRGDHVRRRVENDYSRRQQAKQYPDNQSRQADQERDPRRDDEFFDSTLVFSCGKQSDFRRVCLRKRRRRSVHVLSG